MTIPLLELRDITCFRDGRSVFKAVNLLINQGDVVVLRGKSGSGKTTLLKCIAHLIVYKGDVLYCGSSLKSFGIPSFRTRVFYVPQRTPLLPGTPNDLLKKVTAFSAHQTHAHTIKKSGSGPYDPLDRTLELCREWNIDHHLWDREWSSLSGGEAQRLTLAIAMGLNSAEVLLLDEPTSALDAVSSAAVERYLLNEVQARNAMLKAIVWITHSDEQAGRIGTRFVQLEGGGCHEEPTPMV